MSACGSQSKGWDTPRFQKVKLIDHMKNNMIAKRKNICAASHCLSFAFFRNPKAFKV